MYIYVCQLSNIGILSFEISCNDSDITDSGVADGMGQPPFGHDSGGWEEKTNGIFLAICVNTAIVYVEALFVLKS